MYADFTITLEVDRLFSIDAWLENVDVVVEVMLRLPNNNISRVFRRVGYGEIECMQTLPLLW